MPCLPQAPSGQPFQPLPSEEVGHSSSGQGLCSLGERVLGQAVLRQGLTM
ncbi:rCG60873 [Rattus norvegicus]|uniref:RCG60873 n=1 Tax=Rattus norvegicus TaxID=10116 RepID=A6JJU5_RAT|nr:rCG60873 [Rattus norvegicus]